MAQSLGEIRIPSNTFIGKAVHDAICFIDRLLKDAGLNGDAAAVAWLSKAVELAQLRPHWQTEHKKAFLGDLNTVKAAFYAKSHGELDKGYRHLSELLAAMLQRAAEVSDDPLGIKVIESYEQGDRFKRQPRAENGQYYTPLPERSGPVAGGFGLAPPEPQHFPHGPQHPYHHQPDYVTALQGLYGTDKSADAM